MRAKFIWQARAYERLAVRNFDDRTPRDPPDAAVPDRLRRSVRGARPQPRGARPRSPRGDSARRRSPSPIRASPATSAARSCNSRPRRRGSSPGEAVFELVAGAVRRASLFFVIECDGDQPMRPGPSASSSVCARRAGRCAPPRRAPLRSQTSNEIFNEALRRSIADLYMLVTDTAHGPYPYAGIPWFCTAFGRDGIITAMRAAVDRPGDRQGRAAVSRGDPGRRSAGPRPTPSPARSCTRPGRARWRASARCRSGCTTARVDATPLFVMLAGMYYERTGDLDTIRAIWPNIQAALRWIDQHGDRDGDGFVEYAARSERGLEQPGLEGLARFGVPRRRPARRGPDRAVRGAGLRVRGQAPCRPPRDGARASAAWPRRCAARRRRCGSGSRRRSGAPTSAPMRWRSTAPSEPCRVRSSNAGQVLLSGIASSRRARRRTAPVS